MSDTLEKKLEQAVWIAHSLFEARQRALQQI